MPEWGFNQIDDKSIKNIFIFFLKYLCKYYYNLVKGCEEYGDAHILFFNN